MIIVTHPTLLSIVSGSVFFWTHCKAFQNNLRLSSLPETCFWPNAYQIAPWLYFLFRNSFQYPQSNRDSKRRFETPCSSCCVYHRFLSIASTSHEEGFVTAELHCAISSETQCILKRRFKTALRLSPLQKRVSGSNAYQIDLFSAFQKGVSNPIIKTAIAFIICKNHPESRMETLINNYFFFFIHATLVVNWFVCFVSALLF